MSDEIQDLTPGWGVRAAGALFVSAALVHVAALGALGAGRDAVVGLMAVDLLILVGSTAAASLITRALPEDQVPTFWGAGFVAMFLFGMLFLATWGQVLNSSVPGARPGGPP